MALRVAEADVTVLLPQWDAEEIPISPFLTPANLLTDKVAAADSDGELSAALLAEIEKFLAAHFYSCRDRGVQSEGRGGANANYLGQTAQNLSSTHYGQAAMTLDVTGYLSSLSKGSKVKMFWGGLASSDQTDYEDRD